MQREHVIAYAYGYCFSLSIYDQEGSGGRIKKGELEGRVNQGVDSIVHQRQSGLVDLMWQGFAPDYWWGQAGSARRGS